MEKGIINRYLRNNISIFPYLRKERQTAVSDRVNTPMYLNRGRATQTHKTSSTTLATENEINIGAHCVPVLCTVPSEASTPNLHSTR